jgi:hypothetical protein
MTSRSSGRSRVRTAGGEWRGADGTRARMSDPRPLLRATYWHWLRVRARVRALEAALAAAEHRLRRDARGSDDPDMATLAAQLSGERQAMQALAAELDTHIATVKPDCDAVESTHAEAVVAAARAKSGDLTAADENERG